MGKDPFHQRADDALPAGDQDGQWPAAPLVIGVVAMLSARMACELWDPLNAGEDRACGDKVAEVTGIRETVDLRGLDLRSITGLEGLRGATVNSFQVTELAALFATQLGIKVED